MMPISKTYCVKVEPSGPVAPLNIIDHPAHYTAGKIECIDAIEAATANLTGTEAYYIGNAIKYLWRFRLKNGIEDIKKAVWYLNRLIEKGGE
jgi:hypothetical protein